MIDNEKTNEKRDVFHGLDNDDRYEGSVKLGKLYRIIPDEKAESRNLRVDESGDDYGYCTSRFSGWKFPNLWRKR